MKGLISFKETAEFLGISLETLRQMKLRGDIVFSKIGGQWKISEYDLMEYYEKHKQKPVIIERTKKKKMYFKEEIKPIRYTKQGKPIYC
jgi:excisionase family DNA binding protein